MAHICEVCPVKPEILKEGRAETICSALNGSLEFSLFVTNCLAVANLNKMGKNPQNFSDLLRFFPLLIEENTFPFNQK